MTPPREDPEPPRLQDTTERSALPLPLPGQEAPAPGTEPAPPEAVAAEAGPEEAGVDKAPAVEEPAPEPAAPEPAPADKSPDVDEPASSPEEAASPNGAPSFQDSPFPPPYGEAPSDGPRPEVLIGAAFAGGLLLALIFRRLGR